MSQNFHALAVLNRIRTAVHKELRQCEVAVPSLVDFLSALRDHVDEELSYQKDPDSRYPSGQQIAEDIAEALTIEDDEDGDELVT